MPLLKSTSFERYPSIGTLKQAKGTFHTDVKFHRRSSAQHRVAFHGTVKIHGCNISILFSPSLPSPQIQSRERIITPGDLDCHGAAAFLHKTLRDICTVIETVVSPEDSHKEVMIVGEWAGGDIQPAPIGVHGLQKFYTIFGIRVEKLWLDRHEWEHLRFPSSTQVYNIHEFRSFDVLIDFAEERNVGGGLESANLALEVQRECPVALQIGGIHEGIGEGIVWREEGYQPHWRRETPVPHEPLVFKARGPQYASSGDTAPSKRITDEFQDYVLAFVDFAVTSARLDQGLWVLRDGLNSLEVVLLDNGNINKLYSWVMGDLLKEHGPKGDSELCKLKLDKGSGKDKLGKAVMKRAKEYFLQQKRTNGEA